MKFYWGPNSVPELAGLGKEQQKALFRAMPKEGAKRLGGFPGVLKTHWPLLVAAIIIFFLSRLFLSTPLLQGLRPILFAIVTVVIALVMGNRCIHEARAWLREQGYPHN
jgi:hypothetical protein